MAPLSYLNCQGGTMKTLNDWISLARHVIRQLQPLDTEATLVNGGPPRLT